MRFLFKLSLITLFIAVSTFYLIGKGSFVPSPAFRNLSKKISPYLIREDHPIKGKLDQLFSKKRLLDSFEAMETAGFEILKTNSELNVARHPELPGVIFKFYLDSHDNEPRFKKLKLKEEFISENSLWLLRINGSNRVQKIIDEHRFEKYFKVSKGLIYLLPEDPKAIGPYPKSSIFIEKDMDILSDPENEACYRQKFNRELLEAFHILLKESGLYDSVYIDNNPFCRDGKIAFVDTEEYDRKPIPYEKLLPFFSPEMQTFWKCLIKEPYNE